MASRWQQLCSTEKASLQKQWQQLVKHFTAAWQLVQCASTTLPRQLLSHSVATGCRAPQTINHSHKDACELRHTLQTMCYKLTRP